MSGPSQSDDVERFDRWSSTYESSWMQGLFFDRVHRAVLDAVAAQARPQVLLDIGCGTGRLLRCAARRWPEAQLIGVDPAPGMVRVASRLLPQATFQSGPAEQLPLPDASVDVAMSTMSFHHWQSQVAGLREIARVLRSGGCFVLADASVPAWWGRIDHGARFHDPVTLRRLMQAATLVVLGQRRSFLGHIIVTVSKRD
ncbi:MAG TPA: class I SAM-dependent methyltransferase [Anaerolineae bacterium]